MSIQPHPAADKSAFLVHAGIREKLRVLDELERDEDTMEESDEPSSPRTRRLRDLLWADPPAAELAVLLLNLSWGLSLILIPGLFAANATIYAGTARLAGERLWGVLLLCAVGLHLAGYLFRKLKARYLGVALSTGIWGVAAIAQLTSDTFSPTPIALTLLLFWLFLRLPTSET